MGLFEFRKKKETTAGCCSGNCDCKDVATAVGEKAENVETEGGKAEGARIKVLGSGCAKCNQLEAATKAALAQLGIDTTIDHVTDFVQIASYGVMTTPALVIDKKVVSFGKALQTTEIVELLQKQGGK